MRVGQESTSSVRQTTCAIALRFAVDPRHNRCRPPGVRALSARSEGVPGANAKSAKLTNSRYRSMETAPMWRVVIDDVAGSRFDGLRATCVRLYRPHPLDNETTTECRFKGGSSLPPSERRPRAHEPTPSQRLRMEDGAGGARDARHGRRGDHTPEPEMPAGEWAMRDRHCRGGPGWMA